MTRHIWTPEEDARLREMLLSGLTYRQAGERFNTTREALAARGCAATGTGGLCRCSPNRVASSPACWGGSDMSNVTVTQEDRDAAQALCASGWTHAIEAFARHRTTAVAAKEAELAAERAKCADLEAQLTANEQEVTRLQIALARYGDWLRMGNAPADLQETIDTALATATALKIVPARATLAETQPERTQP